MYMELRINSKGNYGLEIKHCENLNDMFHLDKIIEFYKKVLDSEGKM